VTPLERAIALLKNKGYRTVQQPFGIGTATYSFESVNGRWFIELFRQIVRAKTDYRR
jgi:hypothetical protein